MAQKSEARWGEGASGEDAVQRCKSAGGLCKSAKVGPEYRGAGRGQAVPIISLNRNWHLLFGFSLSAPKVRPTSCLVPLR